jgi:hypothetical protein
MQSTGKEHFDGIDEDKGFQALPASRSILTKIDLVVCLLICAFLAGLALSSPLANIFREEGRELNKRADLTNIRVALAEATLDAQAGRFENARRNASGGFRELRAHFESDDMMQQPETREKVRQILSKREEIMLLIGSRNTDVAEILGDTFYELKNIRPLPESLNTAATGSHVGS